MSSHHTVFGLVFAILLSPRVALADGPCDDADKAVQAWARYITEWAQTASHSSTGRFSVAPHERNGVTLWYELSYGAANAPEFSTVLPQLAPTEGTLTVSVERTNVLVLSYAYGAAGRISCTYEVRPTPAGFDARRRK